MANSFRSKYVLSSLILFLVIFSDQLAKLLFTSTCNPGIAFSFLESLGRLNIFLSFAVLVGVAYFLIRQETKLQIIAASLVLAGGVSILADRIVFGCVRDFISADRLAQFLIAQWRTSDISGPAKLVANIDLKFWPSFNLADGLISVGVVIIAVEIVFKRRESNDLNH